MQLSREPLAAGPDLGGSKTFEKRVVWNLAWVNSLLGGRSPPSIEMLGARIVDAVRRTSPILEVAFEWSRARKAA